MSSENTEDFEELEYESSSSSWEDVEEDGIQDTACHPLLMNSLVNILVQKCNMHAV